MGQRATIKEVPFLEYGRDKSFSILKEGQLALTNVAIEIWTPFYVREEQPWSGR